MVSDSWFWLRWQSRVLRLNPELGCVLCAWSLLILLPRSLLFPPTHTHTHARTCTHTHACPHMRTRAHTCMLSFSNKILNNNNNNPGLYLEREKCRRDFERKVDLIWWVSSYREQEKEKSQTWLCYLEEAWKQCQNWKSQEEGLFGSW